MSAIWVSDTESAIYTIVTSRARTQLYDDYRNIDFVMDNEISDDPAFPTVVIHFMPSEEMGQTLEGDAINGFMCSVQIDVITDREQGQSGARKVMYEMIEQFKKLYFNVLMTPEFLTTGNTDTKRITARVRRVIGANDRIK